MKIEIESTIGNYFVVKSDGKTSEELGWDELLGLVATLTIPDKKPCVHWLKDDIKSNPSYKQEEKILIAIGDHRPEEILRDRGNLFRTIKVMNKESYRYMKSDLLYFNHTTIDTKRVHPECDSWENWLNILINTLDLSEQIKIYAYI